METLPTVADVEITRVTGTSCVTACDVLAIEEPLEIRLLVSGDGERARRTVAVTMRTPGHDAELAAGFLFTEGIVRSTDAIVGIEPDGLTLDGGLAAVCIELAPGTIVDFARLERHAFMTSSCGVCGKTSIDAIEAATSFPLAPGAPRIDAALVHRLPALLRESQSLFDRTGGLHACALFDTDGRLISLREDVGRHNALDKAIGARLLAGDVPLSSSVLLVSGRASFELVQKAVMAGIPILAAVGAPSSLAVSLATRAGLTLLGFVRDGRFNIYTGVDRIRAGSIPS
jgi:FdhD protein